MAELTNVTTLVNGDVFDPEVVSDMINAKVAKKAVMSGYIKVDSTLQGVPGSTITVPRWGYIGEAVDLAEGQTIDTTKMAFTTAQYGIKKIGKGVMLTDEAQLSGYGNPMGTATNQIAMSISEKLDNDRVAVLYESKNEVGDGTSIIKYSAIVDGVDAFGEEEDSRKVILIHSKQKTQLRKDPDFISADKYPGNVVMTGEIGKIANAHVVPSKKVKDDGSNYLCPIVKLNNDAESEDDAPALTIYLKRDTNVETDRVSLARKTDISVDKHYAVALSNTSKVVLAKFKA